MVDRHDADGGDVGDPESCLREGLGGHVALRAPDLVGIMFHPARAGEDLAEFLLCGSEDASVTRESDGARAGGALIEG